MKIIKSNVKNWVDKQGYSKKIFLDEKDTGIPGLLVQVVKIKAGETAKTHYHKKQTEIFYFLTKNGYWIINGEKMTFEVGDILVIEPLDKHLVANDTSEDYLYLAIKYNYGQNDLYWQ